MRLKPHFVYENKTIFVYFLTISGIIHLILIFSTSSISHLLRPVLDINDYGTKDSNYVVEIDLGSDEQKEEKEEPVEEEEEEMVESDVREEKRDLFVDTSGETVDEEPRAETNKIGEKGSVARDNYTDENDINDKPRLESETVFPGEVPDEFAATAPQVSGLPVNVGLAEPVTDANEEIAEKQVEDETVASMPEVDQREDQSDTDAVEGRDQVEEVSVVEDAEVVEHEEVSSQPLSSLDTKPVENIEKVYSDVFDSDVVVFEPESIKRDDTDADVGDKEVVDPVEEYTKTASIPKTVMKELVSGKTESVASKPRKQSKPPERQIENVPTGDDAPFFEDNISNAPMTGAPSFNVKKHEYAQYYKHIKDKIRLYWLLQYGTDASINQVTSGYKPIVVTFKVLPSGKIMNVEIVDSAGNELLASKIRKSIQNTALNTFPDYINEKQIDVKFSYFFFD
ncbi:periplasmic protein, links inner and outer membranes [Candidatus Scalindua japonica]|uniref:Periplasmic protein, links inner and outer membranes n=1 Tax=Candidatus Scalindua japonica TaxID=1284222 RepID=A0A286TTP1_9BACT|nr:TonB C-terminal domain-containing protein [Candidatus Scalindua japonica]GAX59269.1 periplasmic protein, links inner and outer membranes [Candidatus Scalindua japonica]